MDVEQKGMNYLWNTLDTLGLFKNEWSSKTICKTRVECTVQHPLQHRSWLDCKELVTCQLQCSKRSRLFCHPISTKEADGISQMGLERVGWDVWSSWWPFAQRSVAVTVVQGHKNQYSCQSTVKHSCNFGNVYFGMQRSPLSLSSSDGKQSKSPVWRCQGIIGNKDISWSNNKFESRSTFAERAGIGKNHTFQLLQQNTE